MKRRVTGIGGIFFKAKDPAALLAWYKKHLGIATDEYGWGFKWQDDQLPAPMTQLGVFGEDTDYFKPASGSWMINFRVEDLEALLPVLESEGVQLAGGPETYDYGKFAWIIDPEGNKIELWQPLNDF
ncbi:VOC family protein [Robertkochia flava]|uniref:VOC family protein n=1 Tax=Robertkochia flava TaxID=3447986 RepID=UPI001CCC407D|nr:VOC family protein [Robertkochia marina]